MGTRIGRRSSWPQSELFTISTQEEEAGGTSGAREQVGPVQAHGVVGTEGLDFVASKSMRVRSAWVG